MAQNTLKPIRRVVTGNDESGKSKVVWDGTNHAWSNRSSKPAIVAIASHDAA
ncbi:MAG: hypothetical protein ACXWCY_17765 [Burkholderiales bacterium]